MPESQPIEPERERRLETLAGAIELALGPDWFYLCIIGQAGQPQSVNLISNCYQAHIAEELVGIITERIQQGHKPRPHYPNPTNEDKDQSRR